VLIVIPTLAHPLVLLALASTGSGTEELSPYLALALVGLPSAGIGAFAYFGVWRRWARRRVYSPYKLIPLALWWMGIALLASGISAVVPEPGAGYVMLPFATFGMLALVLGTVWLPRVLLPRWYKSETDLERGSSRKRIVVSAPGKGTSPMPLGEDLLGGGEMSFRAASTLGNRVAPASEEAPRPPDGQDTEAGVRGRAHEPRGDGRLRG